MKPHALHSHLNCIANNLGWALEAGRNNALSADKCPSRESIFQRCGNDPEVDSVLCDCERACVGMRDAYNRRELMTLAGAAKDRAICLDKLRRVLSKHGYSSCS